MLLKRSNVQRRIENQVGRGAMSKFVVGWWRRDEAWFQVLMVKTMPAVALPGGAEFRRNP
jgi:hypothetical protein